MAFVLRDAELCHNAVFTSVPSMLAVFYNIALSADSHVDAHASLLVGRGSLILAALLSSSVGVACGGRLSSGGEATRAHVFTTLSLLQSSVGFYISVGFWQAHLTRLNPCGIGRGHLVAFALVRHLAWKVWVLIWLLLGFVDVG